jgi:hypothetical protein
MGEQKPAAAQSPIANLPTIGVLCLIAAAAGGGFEGLGFKFPTLNVESRILIAILGLAAIFFESRAQIAVWLSGHGLRLTTRVAAIAAVVSVIGILVLILQHRFVAPDPPNEQVAGQYVPPQQCPVRPDTASTHSNQTLWINVGKKLDPNSDALDTARNIVEPCLPRNGDTFTIYRSTHLYVGLDPAALVNGQIAAVESTAVSPGQKFIVAGGVSGPELINSKGQLLYYDVWVPVRQL